LTRLSRLYLKLEQDHLLHCAGAALTFCMVHLCQYLTAAADRSPQKVLTVCNGRRTTATSLQSRVAAFTAAITADLTAQRGDVIILAVNSTDHFLESFLAVTAAGAIAAPINLRWSIAEAAAAVKLCHAKSLLVDQANLHLADLVNHSSCSCLQQVVILGQPASATATTNQLNSEQLIQQHMGASLMPQHSPDGAAIICFTSGTTGAPKGVLISHTALHFQALAKMTVVGYNADDCYLHAAPLFHIGGLSSAVAVLMAGGTHVFMGRFNASVMLDIIDNSKVTAFIAVPAMIADLAAVASKLPVTAAATGPNQYHSVQRVLVGAGGMSQDQEHNMQVVFPNATVHTAYGMTEACSSMTFKLLFGPKHGTLSQGRVKGSTSSEALPPGLGVSVGSPPPGVEMAVLTSSEGCHPRDEAMLSITCRGEGELLTRGPHVLMQYWGQPLHTQEALLSGNWLRTGDIGIIDADGQIWLKGRVKDVIRTGGESVHAVEVEKVLVQCPAIQAAAVFGLPHERFGEQVAAVIVLDETISWTGLLLSSAPLSAPSAPLTQSFVKRFCQQAKLSSFKIPRVIAAQYVPLPLNASGKVMKMNLKEALLAIDSYQPSNAADFAGVVLSRL